MSGINKLGEQVRAGVFVEAKFSFPTLRGLRVYDIPSAKLFGQRLVETKERGVEPGFIAKKEWSEKDQEKLLNSAHKYHAKAVTFLLQEKNKEMVASVLPIPPHQDRKTIIEENFPQLMRVEDIFTAVKEHLVNECPKFTKKHYWKLHYAEPHASGCVKIDYAQSQDYLGIHQSRTRETRRNKNLGALMEGLSNAIFNILGFGGQKLSLRLSKYADGHPMFLLDGTNVVGPNEEEFKTLHASEALLPGPQCQGRIRGNLLPDPATKKLVPINERKLGSALLKSLLMGDRDKVGRDGGNLGYVVVDGEAILMNIDPGKSFEEGSLVFPDRMSQEGDVRNDCSFDHCVSVTDQYMLGGYKNFSIFSDTTLADRIQGMKDIVEKWPEVERVFREYIAFFKEHADAIDPAEWREPGDLPMHQVLQKQYGRLRARREYLERIFEDRLDLSDDELNLLDNLEKLTSPTTREAVVKTKEGKVELKHLQIIDPQKNRREWSLKKDGGKIFLTFEATSEEDYRKVLELLNRFLCFSADKNETSVLIKDEKKHINNRIKCRIQFQPVPADATCSGTELLHLFSESKIISYKELTAPGQLLIKQDDVERIASFLTLPDRVRFARSCKSASKIWNANSFWVAVMARLYLHPKEGSTPYQTVKAFYQRFNQVTDMHNSYYDGGFLVTFLKKWMGSSTNFKRDPFTKNMDDWRAKHLYSSKEYRLETIETALDSGDVETAYHLHHVDAETAYLLPDSLLSSYTANQINRIDVDSLDADIGDVDCIDWEKKYVLGAIDSRIDRSCRIGKMALDQGNFPMALKLAHPQQWSRSYDGNRIFGVSREKYIKFHSEIIVKATQEKRLDVVRAVLHMDKEPLVKAARSGSLELVQELTRGSIPKWGHEDAIESAVKAGSLEVVRLLLKQAPIRDGVLSPGVVFSRVLGEACKMNRSDIALEFLLIGQFGSFNRHYAFKIVAEEGSLELVQELLKQEPVSVYKLDEAIERAFELRKFDIFMELLQSKNAGSWNRDKYIVKAAEEGLLDLVQVLLQNGPISNYVCAEAIEKAPKIPDKIFADLCELLKSATIPSAQDVQQIKPMLPKDKKEIE